MGNNKNMDKKINCETCLNFDDEDVSCHLNPPNEGYRYPKVKPTMWCSQWKPNTKITNKVIK
jgi:hypothetical protein